MERIEQSQKSRNVVTIHEIMHAGAKTLPLEIRYTSCEIESLANKTRKIVHANNLKRFSIDYDIDQVYEKSEDTESSECDFDEIGNILPNPEERQNVQRNDDGANVMHGYNLRRNRRMPDRYGIPVVDY
ncbi:Hypothetical predicted protein [Paramuricea clavata]|uniref:Uncharacterized protein n=1 Tax=Paramuricea clavata TaxID=317549 RepID=A0A7D9KAD0_PARCT|nr:Hypothetical predicted protein [Paramuricea clavata]